MSALAKYDQQVLRRMLEKLDDVELEIWADLIGLVESVDRLATIAEENERRISELEGMVHLLTGGRPQ